MASEAGHVDIRVVFAWRDMGAITLDAGPKILFPELPWSPGVYRMTLTGAAGQLRPRVYIGEAEFIANRMKGYRTPGGRNLNRGQTTNIRLNDEMTALLASGGSAVIAISTAATVAVDGGEPNPLDLSAEAARLLAENAALVSARLAGDVDVINL